MYNVRLTTALLELIVCGVPCEADVGGERRYASEDKAGSELAAGVGEGAVVSDCVFRSLDVTEPERLRNSSRVACGYPSFSAASYS